jgi:4-hydroxyphenylpyruvate dioxygenase
MLGALGFSLAGRHRRKAVERWRQGGVNLVLNREKEGFARSFDIMHGGSVCAIGLVVGDVEGAMARAKALGIPHFAQAAAPGDTPIPAVRGVGGSLIYLIRDGREEEVWSSEFVEIAGGEPPFGIGIEAIDHIAQTMPHEALPSWLLFYLALFDAGKTNPVDIPDPLGLIQSQAIETAGKALRVTLNGSLARDTLSSRFVNAYFGAGVQHLAFAAQDIFAAAEGACARGLPILEIPRNYYDDLEARFGLSGDLIDRMAALNILYDRDGEAEYFQFYSRAFDKRVFFEIVERRDYQGYAAVNAPIRLAAQSRFKSQELG